jgi:hypothetical protein
MNFMNLTILILMTGLTGLVSVLPAGCSGGSGGDDAADIEPEDGQAEEAGDMPLDPADPSDAEAPDAEDAADAEEDEAEAPSGPCELLGLSERPFTEAVDDPSLFAVAADVTVATTEGDWCLSENWTGCDVYMFIQDVPRQTEGWPVPLWDRDVLDLIAASPRNVHYFFVSTERAPEAREAALAGLQEKVEQALTSLGDESRAWWQDRIHYIPTPIDFLHGWLGSIMLSPGWGAAVDRFQRVRYIGSYADYRRFDASSGWFAPNLSMAANEAVYYNFEAEREERLDAQDAVVISLFDGQVLSDPDRAGVRGYAEALLPDAAAMAGFDTLELDLRLSCEGRGEYGTCPAWDYIVHLYLCDEADPDTCDVEIGRWITTYHREGRWVHDISSLLPLLGDGGTRRFAFYTQQPYEVTLSLRLSNGGRDTRPAGAIYLFSGGSFNAAYNDAYSPVTLSIPSDAAKVELATVITGHGGADPGNCAEFCSTTHHFFVNGIENVRAFPEAGDSDDCMTKTSEGTVPNQYGTWWYGRSGWCPGKEVPMVTIDVTDQVALGGDNVFEYQGFYLDAPYPSGGASIVMTSWVVISH